MAVRILDSARVMTGLDQTGMNARQIRIARRLIHRPYGVLMVTGPTGSGKTSTLYSALHELNVESRHLVTIEDPVEYQLDGINQVQVDPHIGLGFSDGLRAILRQDPNVIMVGEIRDADTCKTAIRAALTGHLVLSTLHTNSAIGAIGALQNLGGTPYLIGSALTGVVAQRLVRKLCVTCRKTVKATAAPARQLGLKATASLRFPRAVGCEECLNLGYSGRTGIFEVLEITERLRGAILRDETPDALAQIADKDGRVSIVSAGVDKVREKITTPEEIVEKVILDS
jgi:type IV pilus assembly protein PilB